MSYMRLVRLVCFGALVGCGGSDAASVVPDVEDFVVDDSTQSEIDKAAGEGDGAEGS